MRVEAEQVRRSVVALFAVLFAFTLLAASPGPSILGTPVLIVYPFSVNGDITREAGSRLAVAIATQIANLGGVDVKPAPAGVERPNYLDAARGVSADYYVAGYVTPLGDGVSVVEQLVSTQTGIVVYSNSAQVRTFEDAAGQGDILREALLRHQSRNLGGYAAPPPPAAAATPTPAPGSAAQANIGQLFGHRQKRGAAAKPRPSPAAASSSTPAAVAQAAATPSPASAPPAAATAAPAASSPPAAVAAAPRGSGFAILPIGGPAENERRSFTGAALRNDMIANHRRVTATSDERETACKEASIGTLVGGNLSTQAHTIGGRHQTIATLELLAYDCAGNVVYRRTFANDARGSWRYAVNGVVADAVAAFLKEPVGGRRG